MVERGMLKKLTQIHTASVSEKAELTNYGRLRDDSSPTDKVKQS